MWIILIVVKPQVQPKISFIPSGSLFNHDPKEQNFIFLSTRTVNMHALHDFPSRHSSLFPLWWLPCCPGWETPVISLGGDLTYVHDLIKKVSNLCPHGQTWVWATAFIERNQCLIQSYNCSLFISTPPQTNSSLSSEKQLSKFWSYWVL